jgi:hypothetical protein
MDGPYQMFRPPVRRRYVAHMVSFMEKFQIPYFVSTTRQKLGTTFNERATQLFLWNLLYFPQKVAKQQSPSR